MYIAPGQGQTAPRGQNFDVNRKAFSLYPFVASNSKEPQQKYHLGTVTIKILGGLNRFYGIPTSPSASVILQE